MLSNLFGGLTFTMFPVLVLRQFGFGPTGLGLLMTISSLGALAGALAGPVFVKRLGDGHAIPITALYEAVAGFGVPASLLVPHAFAFATLAVSGFVMMFGIVAFNIAQVSLRQRVCPERLLGRMNATVRFAVWGVNPFASLLSGTIAMLIGLQSLFWIGATGSLLALLILVFSPLWHLKKVDSYEEGVAAEGLAELPPPVL
jgi:putative solute:sodium symporter small subunit